MFVRKVLIGLLVASVLCAACGGGDDNRSNDGSRPAAEGTEDADTSSSQDEYLIVDGEDTAIVESCVDTSGQYVGNLPEGGLFILRDGATPQENFVDYLPSQDADPLSSQAPEDTTVDGDGGFVTGTTTVYTEDGANSLEIEFGVVIEDPQTAC
jgi:hypothetical protein